jgi:hypothetical protein
MQKKRQKLNPNCGRGMLQPKQQQGKSRWAKSDKSDQRRDDKNSLERKRGAATREMKR